MHFFRALKKIRIPGDHLPAGIQAQILLKGDQPLKNFGNPAAFPG
jgi:hypothetical protein